MDSKDKPSIIQRIKSIIIGGARSPFDPRVFHRLSLIAFLAWVGLGADGISSSCYGPEEAFLALKGHTYLGIFVALASALTVFVISASYSQIIELFPTGGGGYLVASKLLSPTVGMIAGCALLIDYVLTITISIASGADALFSFLPIEWHSYKLWVAIFGVVWLTMLNLRGVKESVVPLVPIFLTFILTHAFAILYATITHLMNFPEVVERTVVDVSAVSSELGFLGMIFLILRAYSMGAGTFTGIEAVSNALPILREPRVETGKHTMRYMAISLAFMVVGLIFAYLLYEIGPQPGKTLNAILFEHITKDWGGNLGHIFVFITLLSETALLFAAAQAGFLGGPQAMANMALDRWMPNRFSVLSDRLVTQNGILVMGVGALATMLLTRGSVRLLVVLYSINVFITFVLSQLGMVRHWWTSRSRIANWQKKLVINGVGLLLCTFILISVVVLKFHEGGWITLLVTCAVIGLAIAVKRHYLRIARLLRSLDELVVAAGLSTSDSIPKSQNSQIPLRPDPKGKTAAVLVNGFNGLGLHTLFTILRTFGEPFKNFAFVQIGVLDAGNFKGLDEIQRLQDHVKSELNRYISFMQKKGYYAEGFFSLGVDLVDEIDQLAPKILERFPNVVFFAGQLVFPEDSFFSRWLHNYTAFAAQRRLYHKGIPVVILPIRV